MSLLLQYVYTILITLFDVKVHHLYVNQKTVIDNFGNVLCFYKNWNPHQISFSLVLILKLLYVVLQ